MDRIQAIQEMLRDDPDDPFLQYALALEYAKTDLQKAISQTIILLEKDPSYLGAYYKLGQWYEAAGQSEQAIATYQKGITLALEQKNNKTLGELREALGMLEE